MTEAQVKKAEELEITAFGDSVMLDATADLQEIFPKAVVDGDVGRQLYESPELIKALKEKRFVTRYGIDRSRNEWVLYRNPIR